jgi:hypothetical protein
MPERSPSDLVPQSILRDSRRKTCIMTVPNGMFIERRSVCVPRPPETIDATVTVAALLCAVGGALTYALHYLFR